MHHHHLPKRVKLTETNYCVCIKYKFIAMLFVHHFCAIEFLVNFRGWRSPTQSITLSFHSDVGI